MSPQSERHPRLYIVRLGNGCPHSVLCIRIVRPLYSKIHQHICSLSASCPVTIRMDHTLLRWTEWFAQRLKRQHLQVSVTYSPLHPIEHPAINTASPHGSAAKPLGSPMNRSTPPELTPLSQPVFAHRYRDRSVR